MRAVLVLLVFGLGSPAWALQNQLANHPSAYLALHGTDPVHWQDWGADVLAQARAEDKLILISSGYFSCHWCHVMQRESYKDPGIAQQLNTDFIPVKVDRELQGALDSYLIDFMERTQGHAGWPLNVWLTPEGYPLVGATYLPKERFGRVLKSLQETWAGQRDKTRNLARRALLDIMLKRRAGEVEPQPPDVLQERLVRQALSVADPMEGGFGEQSRFPMTPQLLALLEIQARSPNPALGRFLVLTLEQMAHQGLRDHLAGGFFRYTVDPGWQVPHYEKMLYTQAQLALVFLRASGILERPDFAAVARDTLDFVERDMRGAQGGFIASFSAVDGAGVEGGVYLWTIEQLHPLLGEQDTALARRYWRMQDGTAQESGYLPVRGDSVAAIAADTGESEDLIRGRLEGIRTRLLGARRQRDLPADGKELAGWNGLMLEAFAEAAQVLGDDGYRQVALRLRNFLVAHLWDGERLLRARGPAGELGRASLADYAYVARGFARYARLSGQPIDRDLLQAITRVAWSRYFGARGWSLDDEPLIPGLGAAGALSDGALPSPAAVLLRLAMDGDDPARAAHLRQAMALSVAETQAEPLWYAGHVLALVTQPRDPP